MTKKELLDFICELCGLKECSEIILRQITKFVTKHGYSYKDIARALCYYVDVKGNVLDLKYGIGIVPYVADEATHYFEEEARKVEAQKAMAKREAARPVIKVKPLSPKKTIRKRHIDISQL